MKKNNFQGLDYIGIVVSLSLWIYIFFSLDSGTFYTKTSQFDRLLEPGGFWGMILFIFILSILCLYFVFFIGDDD